MDPTPLSTNSLLYRLRQGDVADAFILYERRAAGPLGHDYQLLRHMALATLEQGISNYDPEVQLLCVAAAQMAMTDETQRILERASESRYPPVQLAALHSLAQSGDREAVWSISKALGSRLLPVRMHAAYLLAHIQRDDALDQVNALMSKTPEEFRLFYPSLLAPMESPEATAQLRRLMHADTSEVAANAVYVAAETGRDDLLEDIRRQAGRLDPIRQEVAAEALSRLQDGKAMDQLRALTQSAHSAVRLSALHALLSLHDTTVIPQILQQAANEKDIYAIASLANLEVSNSTLLELLSDSDPHVRANAAIALLSQRDPRCLPQIMELLIKDARDLALVETRSPGGVFHAWRVVPSSNERFARDPATLARALAFREGLLRRAKLLPQEDFLRLATQVLAQNQRTLVPQTITLIQQLGTPEAIDLLQQLRITPGAALIRMYATLALTRLGVPGDAAEQLRDWVADGRQHELIQFRPMLPMDDRHPEPYQELTPNEISRLLLEACMAIAERQQEAGIDTLLSLIAQGHPKNRYALMGLLIRATL